MIKSWYECFALLLLIGFLPFFNVLAKNIDKSLPLLIIFTFSLWVMITLFSKKSYKIKISKGLLFYFMLLVCDLMVSFCYQLFQYDIYNVYFLFFFSEFILMTLVLSASNVFLTFLRKFYKNICLYFIVIIAFFIYVDYLLLLFNHGEYQLMYDPMLSSYVTRPFGILGQPSVNSSLLVALYSLFLYKNRDVEKINKLFFLFVSLAVVLQGSGSGFLSYFVLIYAMFRQNRYYKLTVGLVLAVFVAVVLSGIVEKISWNYIIILYDILLEIAVYPYLFSIKSTSDLLFGISGHVNIPIDFGPIFIIAKVGLIYFILLLSLWLYYFVSNKNIFHRAALVVLLLGNLHYPVMFYTISQFLLMLIIYENNRMTNIFQLCNRRKIIVTSPVLGCS